MSDGVDDGAVLGLRRLNFIVSKHGHWLLTLGWRMTVEIWAIRSGVAGKTKVSTREVK
jgi:hypothetical protein